MRKTILLALILFVLTACNKTNTNVNQSQAANTQSAIDQASTVETNKQVAIDRTSKVETNKVENFLNTSQTISFGGTVFILSWSSHPSDNYYKQEFIPKDEDIERYMQMILVELALGETTAKEAVSQKVRELEARKSTDNISKYQILENKKTNEILLDFMVSEGTGEANKIVEWNAYRYGNYTNKSGQKGVYLFGLSKRGYGKDSFSFISELISNRPKYVTAFTAQPKPEINLK